MATDDLDDGDALTPSLIHEMRHPLMGLKSGLHLLEKSLPRETITSEDWLLVKGQLARLEDLFQCYQDFLHPEQATGSAFSTAPVVQGAVDLLHHHLKRLGRDFTLSLPPQSPLAWGTASSLTHAVTNLVLNALEALGDTPGGRLAVRLKQVETPNGSQVTVRVSDDGRGITPEEAERLFDEGFTTKVGKKGSGLGLKLVRRLLRAHGGSLELAEPHDPDRLPWARTELLLTLPTTAPGAAPSREEAPAPAPHAGPPRALVVDDEAIIIKLLTKTLSAEGYVVTTAATAPQAEALLKTETFELVITDKNLPGGKSGVALAALARARSPRTVILLITAFGNAESARTLLSLGTDGYLQKPFELDELAKRVRAATAVRQSRQAPAPLPAPLPTRATPQVLVHESNPEDGKRISAALTSLGFDAVPSSGLPDVLGTPTATGMVIGTRLLTVPLRDALWSLRASQPDFRVVVIMEDDSLAECIAAMAIGATADFKRPLPEADALSPLLREALQTPRKR